MVNNVMTVVETITSLVQRIFTSFFEHELVHLRGKDVGLGFIELDSGDGRMETEMISYFEASAIEGGGEVVECISFGDCCRVYFHHSFSFTS